MLDRLKAIRAAAEPLAGEKKHKPKALPGLVASLRAARGQDAPAEKPARTAVCRRIAVVAITRHGIALAGKVIRALPAARLHVPEKFSADAEKAAPGAVSTYAGKTGEELGRLFGEVDGIVAIFSLGAVVRLIAPYLQSKTRDPAIVVLDESGKFAIPALSGHLGGANALAGELGRALGAVPVLTTASDVQETLAVDLLGREFDWTVEATHEALVDAAAAVVNEAPVALVQETGRRDWWRGHANGRSGPLPDNLECFDRLEDIDPAKFAAVLWITRRALPAALAETLAGRCVIYRPPEAS